MKAFIIGSAGFVGKYLIDHLQKECKWSVFASKLPHELIEDETVGIINLDILKQSAIEEALKEISPDYVVHLAAQSSVSLSWKNPQLTVDVNIKGAVNLLESLRVLDKKPRVLLIGSGEEYGRVTANELPINEANNLRPGNIYAATKACQNMLGKIYADAYGLEVIMVRAFNHIGPGQSETFVVSDFCKQVAEIEAGKREPVIRVGNIGAKRDFTDVRDVVRAYSALAQKGKAGETYNIGSGKAVAIQTILDNILALSPAKIKVEVDEAKFRPVDIPVIEADISRIAECAGWQPKIRMETTIAETLGFWREMIKTQETK